MSPMMLDLLIMSVIVLLLLAVRKLYLLSRQGKDRWLPRELRNAALVYAEELFRSGGDVPIVAKCDRGYRKRNGVLVLVELKTRKLNRVYPSDIIELSAQRYAIQMQTHEEVADYAYVLVEQTPAKRKHRHRVKLLSAEGVARLALRRHAIITGHVVGNYARGPGLCRHCSFERECKSAANPLD